MTTTSLVFPVPSALGSLDQYIQTANRFPLLTEEQEMALARRLRDAQDIDAARQMVMSHLRLVISVARNYVGYGLPQGDLIQEGNIGLMKAVKRFDPDRGVRLVSFAIHWIKAEIHEYILKNWRQVKIATTKAQRKLFFNLRSMKVNSSTLSPSEVAKVAETLGVKPEEVREMETRFSGGDIALELGPEENDEGRVAPIAYLADSRNEPTEKLEALDERSRTIVRRRWLADDEAATLHELAAEYGVSAERIRQIEAKALQKMKGTLAAFI